MLGGTWLFSPPQADGARSLPLLLKLLGLLQVYELTLLGAGALLGRREGLERDRRNLMLVLCPFLLDVTMTTSSLGACLVAQVGPGSGALLAVGVLGLVAFKGALAARLCGRRFDPLEWTTLLAGPALVCAFPVLGATLAEAGCRAEVGMSGGLLLASLTLLFGWTAARNPEGAVRRLAPLVLVGALVHTLGTVWTYSGELLHAVGPGIVALGVALPWLAWPESARRDEVTPFVLPIVGAIVCGEALGYPFGVTGWQIGLWSVAALHGVLFFRTRSVQFLAGLLVSAHLAWGGAFPSESLAAIGSNALEPALLMTLFGYGVWRRAHVAILGPTLLLAGASSAHALDLQVLSPLAGLDAIGLGLLAWTLREHGLGAAGARARLAGVFLLFAPASVLALTARDPAVGDLGRIVSWSTVVALLAPALFTRLRVFWIPALILPVQGAVSLAPQSSHGWGALGVLAAFVVVSLGVGVSLRRERLLAWLERRLDGEPGEGQPVPLRRPRQPESALARAALAAGLTAALALGVLPSVDRSAPDWAPAWTPTLNVGQW
jgi:hypothetical protein